VGVGGAAINLEEIGEESITIPPPLTVDKKVGQASKLTVNLWQPWIGLKRGPIESTEFPEWHEKAVVNESFSGGRNAASGSATKSEAERRLLQ
jgi:hypothetical protein